MALPGPLADGSSQFLQNIRIGSTRTLQHVERVIGRLDYVQCHSRAKLIAYRPQEFEVGEWVARSLEEKHWQSDLLQVLRALCSWPIRRVKREAEEYQASNVAQAVFRSRERGHSSSKRLPAGEERQIRSRFRGGVYRRDDASREHSRLVRNFPPPLHIGKLESPCRYSFRREFARERLHKRMSHSGARAVRQHQQTFCVLWPQEDRWHLVHIMNNRYSH